MAGAGRRTFVPGEVLTASNVNSYLMDQAVMVFDDATERDVALGTAIVSQGMTAYTKDDDVISAFDGTDWVQVHPYVDRAGSIVQVVQTVRTTVFSENVSSNSNSANVIDVSITPKSISNKILVFVNLSFSSANNRGSALLTRGGTATTFIGGASGSRSRMSAGSSGNENIAVQSLSLSFLDSPSSTSALTYAINLYNNSGTAALMYLNRSVTDTDSASFSRYASSITVMEVAG
jgi:hypothetical protein